MGIFSDIFGFESSSNRGTGDEESEDASSDIFADIANSVQRKLSWCMFKAREFQRRAQTQPQVHERRKMHGRQNYFSDNTILENETNLTSKQHDTRVSKLDRMETKSNAFWSQTSADSIGKTKDLSTRRGIPKYQTDSAISTTLVQREMRIDLENTMTTKLAARRRELRGMTSSQRVAHFRQKYGLKETRE